MSRRLAHSPGPGSGVNPASPQRHSPVSREEPRYPLKGSVFYSPNLLPSLKESVNRAVSLAGFKSWRFSQAPRGRGSRARGGRRSGPGRRGQRGQRAQRGRPGPGPGRVAVPRGLASIFRAALQPPESPPRADGHTPALASGAPSPRRPWRVSRVLSACRRPWAAAAEP